MNPTRTGANEHPLFRTAASAINRVLTSFEDVESLTRQDQAEMVNINNIYKKTQQGSLSLVASNPPTFGDFSDVGTYDQILETISEAKEAFMALPSEVRKEYNHDPSIYYEKITAERSKQEEETQNALLLESQAEAHKKSVTKAKKLLNIEE